jgi:hypothetical protein
VETLIGDSPDDLDPLEAIGWPIGQSLVFVLPLDETTSPYGMLETIREFALEQLDRSEEAPQAHRHRAKFVRGLASPADRTPTHWAPRMNSSRSISVESELVLGEPAAGVSDPQGWSGLLCVSRSGLPVGHFGCAVQ